MSKLPDELAWADEALSILEQTDKTSVKAVCTTIKQAASEKATKEASLAAVKDLATWSKEAGVFWLEPYLITTFDVVMACIAEKQGWTIN